MSLIILGILFLVSYKMNKNWKLSLFYMLISMYMCRYAFYARAWQWSFIFIILEYYFIQKLLEEGKLKYSIGIVAFGILISNIHASVFPIYLVIFLPYIVEAVLYKFKMKIPKIEIVEHKYFKKFFITFIITCFSGLVNPFGLLPYTYIVKNMSGFSSTFIGELAPTTFENNKLFFIVILAVILFSVNGKQKIKVTDIFYILGFSILTLLAYRSFYYFVFISGMAIIRIINDFFKENNWKMNKILMRLILVESIILFVAVALSDSFRMMKKELVPQDDYPVQLAEYILENIDIENMRLYNGFNYGSYLEFRGIKTFVDSRSEVFCEEFNSGCTVLKDWYAVAYEEEYNRIFYKYNITHAITSKSESLTTQLEEDENWILIYEDEYWNLYEKK